MTHSRLFYTISPFYTIIISPVILEKPAESCRLIALLYEEESADTTADPVISSMYLDDMLHRLRKENPVFLDIVYLRADGLTLDEISERLNIPRTTLHRMLQKIRQIAESV